MFFQTINIILFQILMCSIFLCFYKAMELWFIWKQKMIKRLAKLLNNHTLKYQHQAHHQQIKKSIIVLNFFFKKNCVFFVYDSNEIWRFFNFFNFLEMAKKKKKKKKNLNAIMDLMQNVLIVKILFQQVLFFIFLIWKFFWKEFWICKKGKKLKWLCTHRPDQKCVNCIGNTKDGMKTTQKTYIYLICFVFKM